jgi:hypothetical protein
MRVPAIMAFGAMALWGFGLNTPGNAGTMRSSAGPSHGADAGSDELRSLANAPSSFDPSSQSYLFESADLARVVGSNAGCKNGVPDTTRGTGGSGSKRRHSAPTVNPCPHSPVTGSTPAVSVVLHPFVASSACGSGGVQPAGQPSGGSSSKKRHQTPLSRIPCRPRADSAVSNPMVLSMTFASGGRDTLLPLDESTNPGGGSNGKHRHSPPSAPPQVPGGNPQIAQTPEPGGLLLLGSGLLTMCLILRRRTVRGIPPR